MSGAQFWLIAGPNGAGKSTLAKSPAFANLALPKILNPDDVALRLLRGRGHEGYKDAPIAELRDCFIQAAEWVFSEVEYNLRSAGTIGVETVLSTRKYLPLFHDVAASGGEANLIYIGNQSPEISAERVAIRVRKGGHDVPADKILSRWHRSLELLPVFWQLASQAWLFDHSDAGTAPFLVAHKFLTDQKTATHVYRKSVLTRELR